MDPLRQLTETLRDRYDVEREVGAGGMATVYRARDLRHDRLVALKVLRPELGAVLGAERFLAEIKVTANLQHPNILPLFDSGEAEGLLYYVMPFVDGETLRARLDRERQLPIEEAISITRAIANALDYAHAASVIHRDLKPENILFQAGQPVLADFGIALAVANAGGTRITQTGLSLGTPQYMSPEQATGDRVIDGRTDLYSLGAVLYEMLTGEPPHSGTTAQAIIARVLTDKPRSARSSRDTIPPNVEAALERVLAKLPADRFSSGREFSQALGAGFVTTGVAPSAPATQDIRFSFSISKAALARTGRWAAIAAALVLGAWGWLRPSETHSTPRMRFVLATPDSLTPASSVGQHSVVISPDGSEFVYPSFGTDALLRRRFDGLTITPVPESRGAANPRYDPRGGWLAFEASGRLLKVPLAGGPSVRITDSANRPTWGDEGTVVFARNQRLWRVTDAGGAAVPLTTVDSATGEVSHTWPHMLPGGKAVLFEIALESRSVDEDEIAVARLSDGRVTRLGLKGSNPRYAASGHVLFARQDGRISAAPFDLSRLRVTGQPVSVLDGVVVKTGGAAMYSVSDNGTLIYIDGSSEFHIGVVAAGRPVRQVSPRRGNYLHPRLSPSGDRVAFALTELGRSDVWTLTFATGEMFRLTRDGNSWNPEWMPDGRRVAWVFADSARDVIRVQSADGSGTPRTVRPLDGDVVEFSVAPVGDLAAVVGGPSGHRRITVMPLDSDGPGRVLLSSAATIYAPHFSPDGRWIAFVSPEPTRDEVFVARVDNPGTRFPVTTDGAVEPAWTPDGRGLTYRSAGYLRTATLSFSPRFEVVSRDSLFAVNSIPSATLGRDYDVSRRTGEFVVRIRNIDERERILVVTDWLSELRERMASAARR